jgi:hypothetical protein
VRVHPEDVHIMKLRVRDQWRAAKDVGWWFGQESPVDLCQMQTNAFRFIMDAKQHCNELRRFYLEAEDGFIRYSHVPFLPVYLVPTDKELWPLLAPILLKMVRSIKMEDWVKRFKGVKKLNPTLVQDWNSVLREPQRAAKRGKAVLATPTSDDDEEDVEEADESNISDDEEEDSAEERGETAAGRAFVQGKLYHLGGAPRVRLDELQTNRSMFSSPTGEQFKSLKFVDSRAASAARQSSGIGQEAGADGANEQEAGAGGAGGVGHVNNNDDGENGDVAMKDLLST